MSREPPACLPSGAQPCRPDCRTGPWAFRISFRSEPTGLGVGFSGSRNWVVFIRHTRFLASMFRCFCLLAQYREYVITEKSKSAVEKCMVCAWMLSARLVSNNTFPAFECQTTRQVFFQSNSSKRIMCSFPLEFVNFEEWSDQQIELFFISSLIRNFVVFWSIVSSHLCTTSQCCQLTFSDILMYELDKLAEKHLSFS